MKKRILLASVGAGKTEMALDRLARLTRESPFARAWVLVSGKRQEDSFRERLADRHADQRIYFNVEFFSFYQLNHRITNIALEPPRRLDDAARFSLLRSVLADAQPDLRVFGRIATAPGFLRIMADFIYELKQSRVGPDEFHAAARTGKDHDLVTIYRAYQQRLIDYNLVDREGEGWLALAKLAQHPHIGTDVDLLLVDGYDQFTPLQAHLLMTLADRARETLITLTDVPGREDTIGRRFQRALAVLQSVDPDPSTTEIKRISAPVRDRHPVLVHLEAAIFRAGVTPRPTEDRVFFLEAPDPVQEAAAVLRRIKHLLLYENSQPDDIIIALRDWPRYAPHFLTLGRAYDLPLALHYGEPLLNNPAVLLLLDLLQLHEGDFRRHALLDVLRSPYIAVPGLDAGDGDTLEAISRRLLVTGGREAWLQALGAAANPVAVEDEIDEEPLLDDPAEADRLAAVLAAFFNAVTPPVQAPLEGYVRWLDDLIGPDVPDPDSDPAQAAPAYTLDMMRCIRAEAGPGLVERDMAAVVELRRVLRALLAAENLLRSLGESRRLDWPQFQVDLTTAIESASINRSPSRSGRILVTTVTDARGLPHAHVFVPGLSEGVFPAPLTEDPIYLDSERDELIERSIPLEPRSERAADEGLFYELISMAGHSLTLSRPTVQNGAPWVASHLWRAAAAVFSDAETIIRRDRVALGAVARVDQAAAFDEAVLAVADGLNDDPPSPAVAAAYNWLLAADGDHWRRVRRARQMEASRLSRFHRHDHFSGFLQDPASLDYVRGQLTPARVWSASQLNDYGACGFRFFAKRLLKLEEFEEPEDGVDVARLGTINHEILEKTYAEVQQQGLAIAPENALTALAIMRGIADEVLDHAPAKLGFKPTALWQQESRTIRRRLAELVQLDFSGEGPVSKKFPGPRYAYWQEADFGRGQIDGIPIEVDGQPELLRVRGFIDRADRAGDELVVIDYKSGSTRIPVDEMREGRNFQMMTYLLAAQQLLLSEPDGPAQVGGGLFWHIRSRQISGDIHMDDDGTEAVEQARDIIGRYISAGRRGDFTVQPNKVHNGRCTHYCEFSQLCRAASTSRSKPPGGRS